MNDRAQNRALFEQTPVLRALLRLAIPTAAGQIILVIYNMADTFFIGLRGDDAMLTAVTVCLPAFMFLSAISNLFGVGGAAAIARALGAKNYERAYDSASFAFWGCLFTTVLYCVFSFILINPFLNALGGTDPAVHILARAYMIRTVIIGGIPSAMGMLLSHLIRSVGNSFTASAGIALGGLLNIGLDPLFMFCLLPPGHEVKGAATATALSNVISLLFFITVLFIRKRRTAMRALIMRSGAIKDGIPGEILGTGLPACIMTLFENISYGVLEKFMSFYGTDVQAGIGVAKKINMLSHSIVRGIAQGALPFIAYNYSSKAHARMKKGLRYAIFLVVGTSAVIMAVYLAFSVQLTGVFIQHESGSLEYGAAFLRILCVGAPFSACAYTFISFFQATGHPIRSFFLAILRKGILDIPLMFIMFMTAGKYGITSATPIADAVCCIAALLMYRHWKQKILKEEI